jgi:hypothetical protein
LATHVGGVPVMDDGRVLPFVGRGGFQIHRSLRCISLVEFDSGIDRRQGVRCVRLITDRMV